MTLPLSSPFGPVVDQEQQHNHVVNDINNNSNANNFSNSDDIDTFEIFDPRGLFSPATNHHHQALSSDNLIRLKNQTQQHQQQASPASPPSLQSSFAFNDLPPWSIDTPAPAHHHHHHHQTEQPAYKPIDDLTNPNSPQQSSHSFSPPNSTFDLPTVTTTPRMISPVESPISPCSSLPFCRSPPTSLSLNQSGSHMRGRSPLPDSSPMLIHHLHYLHPLPPHLPHLSIWIQSFTLLPATHVKKSPRLRIIAPSPSSPRVFETPPCPLDYPTCARTTVPTR
ncbi:hypothetical protein KEM48_000267 [Puccinia striiformis f. sp. tritici PST-130]|nr:hypothetical protein KEM48_000267 [Puccinia striiformis f. sp. tritici PST-130]